MWNTYFGKRLNGFRYAIRGAWFLLRNEPSIQVQTAIACIMIVAGFFFHISTVEWMLQIVVIGLVLSIEALNTSIEKLADFVHPQHHKKIESIKDIAAGAVFIAALAAVILACIIYIPKL